MFKRNGVINMGKERYSILFSSMTGNTKELADAIREILPEETLDYFGLCKDADPQSEILLSLIHISQFPEDRAKYARGEM